MSTGVLVLISYFLLGIIALGVFDVVTGRIRRNWNRAVVDTMMRMSEGGVGLGVKACVVLFAVVLWVFWPVVLFGAAQEVVADITKNRRSGDG